MRAAARCLRGITESALSEYAGFSSNVSGNLRRPQLSRTVARACHTRACSSAARESGKFQGTHIRWKPSTRIYPVADLWSGHLNPGATGMYSTSAPTLGTPANAKAQAASPQYRRVTLSNLKPSSKKYRKRRARGGGDKQAGRGHKGQKSRSGASQRLLCSAQLLSTCAVAELHLVLSFSWN